MIIQLHTLLALIAALAALVAPRSAHGTTFVLADTKDLLAVSELVVLGRVQSIRSVEEGNSLRTHVAVAVEEAVKGRTGAVLTLVEPGGLVGNRRRWIYGAPTFFMGERVLLFLRRNPRHELETAFLGMGKFTVVRSSRGTDFAVRNLADAHVLAARSGRLERRPSVTSEGLDALLARARGWVAAQGQQAPADSSEPAGESSQRQENFTFAGPPQVRWFLPDDGASIAYRVSSGGDAALGNDASVEAASAALAAWSGAACTSVNLVAAGTDDDSHFTECDGRTEITFNDPSFEIDDPTGCWGVLAVGGVCADNHAPESFNGALFYRITEGDVMVNNGFGACPFWNQSNVAEILTHEVGHTLGLGHSSEDPNEPDPSLRDATMFYQAHFDGRGAKLMSDDIAAVCALYPAGRSGSVRIRRFAIVSDPSAPAQRDRLVVDGVLNLEGRHFDSQTDTLIIDLRSGGASVFRLAVVPGTWMQNPSGTRFRHRSLTAAGSTTVVLSAGNPGILHLSIRGRGLDLSAADIDPVVMSLALGSANVTETLPALRTEAKVRVYP